MSEARPFFTSIINMLTSVSAVILDIAFTVTDSVSGERGNPVRRAPAAMPELTPQL
jgi:hypothetical protein